LISKVINP